MCDAPSIETFNSLTLFIEGQKCIPYLDLLFAIGFFNLIKSHKLGFKD